MMWGFRRRGHGDFRPRDVLWFDELRQDVRWGGERVLIVNGAFQRRFVPGRNIVGARSTSITEAFKVIGLTADVPGRSRRDAPEPLVMAPLAQMPAGHIRWTAFALVSVALTATWLPARRATRMVFRSSHCELNESDARAPLGLCPRRCCRGRSGQLVREGVFLRRHQTRRDHSCSPPSATRRTTGGNPAEVPDRPSGHGRARSRLGAPHRRHLLTGPARTTITARPSDRFNGLRHPVIYSSRRQRVDRLLAIGFGQLCPARASRQLAQDLFRRSSSEPRRQAHSAQERRRIAASSVSSSKTSGGRMQDVTFATVHLLGSRNGLRPFPTRTAADDEEVRRRTEAAAAWLRESFAEATAARAPAVVLAFHGTLGLGQPPERAPGVRAVCRPRSRRKSSVSVSQCSLVHGDAHELTVDHPLVRRATGRWLANLTRLEVPGSPNVGWVRVVVTPGAAQPFTFQPLIVSGWRFW